MRPLCALLVIFLTAFAGLPAARAGSLASRNRKGNELYKQGKYADAEKAYLDAQVNNPGNPKILYNLGNSMIRQKKYDQGIQALNQAIEKGDKAEKRNSWYNEGNAFYSMGKYGNAADAYIRALKLDPTDKEAKQNLELTLMKLKQQQQNRKPQNKANSDSKKKDAKGSGSSQSPEKKEQKRENQNRQSAGQNEKKQNEPARREKMEAPERKDAVSREKALQILDAVQNQELEEQRKLLEKRARQRAGGRDW